MGLLGEGWGYLYYLELNNAPTRYSKYIRAISANLDEMAESKFVTTAMALH